MLTIILNAHDLKYCAFHARQSMYGGQSSIRTDNRDKKLFEDNLIGVIGEYAGCLYLFGSAERHYHKRLMSQELHKLDSRLGDNGQDILGLNVDFKTSRQYKTRNPIEHTLAVRPKEKRDNHIYFLVIVSPNNGGEFMTEIPMNVHIVGWCVTEMLPKTPQGSGVFKGAYILSGNRLNKPMPLMWNWRKYVNRNT